LIDYRVHYVGANGPRRPKVLKLTRRHLGPRQPITITRRHRFDHATIRRIHPRPAHHRHPRQRLRPRRLGSPASSAFRYTAHTNATTSISLRLGRRVEPFLHSPSEEVFPLKAFGSTLLAGTAQYLQVSARGRPVPGRGRAVRAGGVLLAQKTAPC
jgi:hypothetical protein